MALDIILRCVPMIFFVLQLFTNKHICLGFNCSPPKISLVCAERQLTTFPSEKCNPGNRTYIHCLILSKNRIRKITAEMFSGFKNLETLKIDNNGLTTIEPGAFDNLTSLRSLVLSKNQLTYVKTSMFTKLKKLDMLSLDDNRIFSIQRGSFDELNQLVTLNLEKNMIDGIPRYNNSNSTVRVLHLAHNPVTVLKETTLKHYPYLQDLYLRRTKILHLPAQIFQHNTKLKILDLSHNPLEFIDGNAFDGIELEYLNLQGTHISQLPGKGMENVLELNIIGVKELWELPFKAFENLREADVEYHFHCCLFKKFLEKASGSSLKNFTTVKVCPTSHPLMAITTPFIPTTQQSTTTERPTDIFHKHKEAYEKDMNISFTFPPEKCVDEEIPVHRIDDKKRKFVCRPLPDAFNPCEDLLGSMGLRVCTWFVLVFALVGNGLQLIVLLTSKRNTKMYQVLMCNLSVANLLMGIYLTMLAVTDARTLGEYQNHARAWQYGPGCSIAGFLSILSTELAVFTLSVITIERYFTIVHPLKLHMHLSTKQIMILMIFGWLVALILALLPLLGVSNYERVAICLPFDVASKYSKGYVTFLLVTNGFAFLTVLFCYARMYLSLGGATCSSATRIESRVARKMALLVFSNFACWFPIALFSFIAIYGSPIIDVPTSKFLLVFIYPINAFTNPYLYALGTKHFQLDLLDLLKSFGLCGNAIEKLRSRLRDQLASLPNTSRAYMGSRSSVNSTMYRAPSPNGENSPNIQATTKTSTGSCSLHFLSIPKMNLPSFRDNNSATSNHRSNSCISNDTSSDHGCCCQSQPLIKDNYNDTQNESHLDTFRRLSAREVIIGGKVANKEKYQNGGSELYLVKPSSKNNGQEVANQNQPFDHEDTCKEIPVVMVTSC